MAYDKRDGNRTKKGGNGAPRGKNENAYHGDEVYNGESTRPKRKPSPSERFFSSGGQSAKQYGHGGGRQSPSGASGRTQRVPQNFSAPPRTAKPKYPVPPAVQVDAEGARAPRDNARGGQREYGRGGYDAQKRQDRDYAPTKNPAAKNDFARGQSQHTPPKGTYGAPQRRTAPPVPATPRDDVRDEYDEIYGDPSPRDDRNGYTPAAPGQEYPENLLVGRNPIREAIRAGRTIEKLLVANGELSGSAREIVAKAHENHVVVQKVDKSRLDAIYPKHQGMLAYVSEANYSTVEEILDTAKERGEDPFIVVLDGITDPHNLGAIIRTAECAGAHGVIVTERRSAGLNPAAVKASAGALNYIKVAKVVNLNRTLAELKEAGLWITGAAMDGEAVDTVDLSGPIALVVGSEGDGIAQLVRKNCDRIVSLPIKGKIESLNASVAAGILLYDVLRARK